MIFYFYILVFLLSLITLGVSSGISARSFIKLSRVIGLNEYFISFLLMGIVTSIPEFFISLASIVTNTPLISVGNIIGANFVNITLVLGLVAIFSNGISLSGLVSKRVFWLSFLLSILPPLLVLGGGISRSDGFLLCFMFLIYLVLFCYDGRFLEKSVSYLPYGADYFREIYSDVTKLLIGLAFMIPSSLFIVFFTMDLVNYLSISLLFFAILFLGLITTLPELFFGVRGAILRHPALALGNILASLVFNGTVIMGFLSIISPIVIRPLAGNLLLLNSAFMILAFVFLSIFSYTRSRISRLEGVLLVLIYFLFIIFALFTL